MHHHLHSGGEAMLYNAAPIERLGIPAYNWWNEALHGVDRRRGAKTPS